MSRSCTGRYRSVETTPIKPTTVVTRASCSCESSPISCTTTRISCAVVKWIRFDRRIIGAFIGIRHIADSDSRTDATPEVWEHDARGDHETTVVTHDYA